MTSTYDAVPYPGFAYFSTHPNVIETTARFFGLPPLCRPMRVLELGCGAGVNLLAIAQSMPESEFWGVDLSEGEISLANAWKYEAQIKNAHFECASLEACEACSRPYECIIAHGLYSWISPHLRDQFWQTCVRSLARGGLLYVSYNVNPGFLQRTPVREALLHHVANVVEPADKIARARAFLKSFGPLISRDNEGHFHSIRRELALLETAPDAYLFHEHLESDNHAFLLTEVVGVAQTHGFRFVSEADYARTRARLAGPKAYERLQQLARSNDPVDIEQLADFIENRAFRRTLFSTQEFSRCENSRVDGLHVSCPLTEISSHSFALGDRPPIAIDNEPWVDFLRAAISVYPATLPVDSALDTRIFFSLIATGTLEPWVVPITNPLQLQAFPLANRLNRAAAKSGFGVTNARHENVVLAPVERQLLATLDGSLSLSELVSRDAKSAEILERFRKSALLV